MRTFQDVMCCFFSSGHSGKITGLNYVKDSIYYVSSDANNLLLVSDIRNGNVLYSSTSWTSDKYGIQSVGVMNNGDLLVLSKTEIYLINVFT